MLNTLWQCDVKHIIGHCDVKHIIGQCDTKHIIGQCDVKHIIGHCDVKHMLTSQIKTIKPVLKISTYTITARPVRLAAILVIV